VVNRAGYNIKMLIEIVPILWSLVCFL